MGSGDQPRRPKWGSEPTAGAPAADGPPPTLPAGALQDGDGAACPSEARRCPTPGAWSKASSPDPITGPLPQPAVFASCHSRVVTIGVGRGVGFGIVLSPLVLQSGVLLGLLPQLLLTLPSGLFQGRLGVWRGQSPGLGVACGLGDCRSPSDRVTGRWDRRTWIHSLLGPALPQL